MASSTGTRSNPPQNRLVCQQKHSGKSRKSKGPYFKASDSKRLVFVLGF